MNVPVTAQQIRSAAKVKVDDNNLASVMTSLDRYAVDVGLDRLVEALQFCDLLSLYLSCGLQGPVTFPQAIGKRAITLNGGGDRIRLSPSPFAAGISFTVAAIRHPKTAEASSSAFATYVEG